MASILVIVFFVQLAIHLVNTVGAPTINSLLWNLYNRFPTPTSKTVAEQRELKNQFVKIRQELNATSSQDEFAKWAKLRRQHDKLLEQVEKSKSSIDSTKTTFDSAVNTLRWLGTNGLRMLLQFWFSKQPMFWIPSGWVPYYAEWLLSFPRAPLGSISIQAWVLACGAIILLVNDAMFAMFELVISSKTSTTTSQKTKTKEEPMKASATKKEL